MATTTIASRSHGDCLRVRHMPREAVFELLDLERDVERRVHRRSARWDAMERRRRDHRHLEAVA